MALILHILIALTSIAGTTYAMIAPSKTLLRANYGLVGLTLASGTYLVWSTGSPLLQSCMTGLVYLGIVLSGLTIAHRRLARD